jgi:hypothetical protein
MRGPGYDSDSGGSEKFENSKKCENFIRNIAPAIIHQKYPIFIGKFLESSQFV